ncbi:PEP-CTERM sorting domain-containing protein [Plectonema cf. radiosum LEGE 06105]|uniref:PEP-CTERM sorting domain-containing protein n=1 Tax=Plectonema cf. radiosum LEGE 06105 TaxID=945769 RepID=A0A8J7FHF3_9CYAN|nr:PEP-CTERM sorting domain-containing protein [Plectonema radiosum]MBE9213776.1 PEP-CTERM sorting domain-containing protein [Plectonema cf. radiosum LEGE 06105]
MTNSTVIKMLSMLIASAVFIAMEIAGSAALAITLFQDRDSNDGLGSPLPNSNAAAQFDNAASTLGGINLINFENLPLGDFSTLEVAPDVTLTLSNVSNFNEGITNDTTIPDLGFNTTEGGANFLRFETEFVPLNAETVATANFSFANPIQAFGANITALDQTPGIQASFLFNDGTSQSIPLVGVSPFALSSAQFFGFTNPDKPISSVTVQQRYTNVELVGGFFAISNYTVGIDDVRYVKSVPEPSSFLSLLAFGVIGGCSVLKRKRQQNADIVGQCTARK